MPNKTIILTFDTIGQIVSKTMQIFVLDFILNYSIAQY